MEMPANWGNTKRDKLIPVVETRRFWRMQAANLFNPMNASTL